MIWIISEQIKRMVEIKTLLARCRATMKGNDNSGPTRKLSERRFSLRIWKQLCNYHTSTFLRRRYVKWRPEQLDIRPNNVIWRDVEEWRNTFVDGQTVSLALLTIKTQRGLRVNMTVYHIYQWSRPAPTKGHQHGLIWTFSWRHVLSWTYDQYCFNVAINSYEHQLDVET